MIHQDDVTQHNTHDNFLMLGKKKKEERKWSFVLYITNVQIKLQTYRHCLYLTSINSVLLK